MSVQYDEYLDKHKTNVEEAFQWILHNLPDLIPNIEGIDWFWQMRVAHDLSKNTIDEYAAYDNYFYGNNQSYAVVQAFNYAWLSHIHRNKHHWQHWVLVNDDPENGTTVMDMPYEYVIEMICDWWSFSWVSGDLFSIFTWFDERKDYIKLSEATSKTVNDVLSRIKLKLEESKK